MKSLEFDPDAFEDLTWWVERDRKKALKIIRLIDAIQRDPFGGIGQPKALKLELAGCWSRRIDEEHRIIYQVQEEKIRILACRYHYYKRFESEYIFTSKITPIPTPADFSNQQLKSPRVRSRETPPQAGLDS